MNIREGFVTEESKPAETPRADVERPEPLPPREKTRRAVSPPQLEESPAEQPPLEQDQWPITVKLLYRAIRNNKSEEIRELRIREPRAGDINRYGNPIRINQDGDVIIDERKMTYMMAALCDILPPFIETMDPRDWNSVAYRLRRFFLPDPAAW
jgi:tail assembly chaperone E/41/14-like protein